MADLEKVLKGLEWVINDIEENGNINHAGQYLTEIKDALELLKEQEAIPVDTKVIGVASGDIEVHCCRDCRTILDPAFHYCPNCGKAVKWDD